MKAAIQEDICHLLGLGDSIGGASDYGKGCVQLGGGVTDWW